MSETPTLKPCPFCGETPDPATAFQEADTCKWGAVHCGCGARGPDTRTEYDMKPGAPWNADAAEEWNRRGGRAVSRSGHEGRMKNVYEFPAGWEPDALSAMNKLGRMVATCPEELRPATVPPGARIRVTVEYLPANEEANHVGQ